MNIDLEYGSGTLSVEVPDTVDTFVAGETVPDPPHLANPVAATEAALNAPLGLPRIEDSVGPGSKVTIIFPDKVKGGTHATAHRRVTIPLVLARLHRAGVLESDIMFICSNGLHAKNTPDQIRALLGEDVFDRFWPAGQIINHDSEDYDHLVDLGHTGRGDTVIMNKYVHDSDLAILIGHALGNPYGGYSGGYKHCATGLSHWKSIAAHHVPAVMHRPDFVPVSTSSMMRHQFDEIGEHMEKSMRRPFFCVDAVLDSASRQIAVFAGSAKAIEAPSWEVADQRTCVPWAQKSYDVLLFGLPQAFQYGDGMGTNPIMVMQAISAQIVRHKRILSERCVVIAVAELGWFNEELFTGHEEVLRRFAASGQVLSDLAAEGARFAVDAAYIDRYRNHYAFHPFHAFSMISSAELAEQHAAALYVVGARQPGLARSLGMRTRDSVTAALNDARTIVGDNPAILALPRAFTRPAVHLFRDTDSPTSNRPTPE
ncbi:MAG: lactate racemase domain-containing protein [Propioniciclava sp.]